MRLFLIFVNDFGNILTNSRRREENHADKNALTGFSASASVARLIIRYDA